VGRAEVSEEEKKDSCCDGERHESLGQRRRQDRMNPNNDLILKLKQRRRRVKT